jgi:hypothetical protein
MKIIYEQGDIVKNENNFTYGVVLEDFDKDEYVKILESSNEKIFINNVPKGALTYVGKCNLKEKIDEFIRKGRLNNA